MPDFMNTMFEFSEDYVSFIKNLQANEINSENGYIELFPLDELKEINNDYETEKFVPNYIAIGTNGGGVGIFINRENNSIYSIPFIGMQESDAILLAKSFSEFLYKFENGELEIY
ncbi:SMI1/KNR4 family protein [Chryseobacterium fluminis]|uniref:SMI1/KNR4 family protein n=1 Tax=Chryseobacterium fluminis TaxID=2983606 RepID=UPI002254660E|nr:SMI1/KNR4 family protein [Chryseobacterium sp. MMS21-Ot14]UZT98213.1 SMI1/KNR4 family protein [Chryseobacterium sp. MMS21-Ot14]